jgi:preprotein translocase subunit YajC
MQIPTEVPKPQNNTPIDLSSPFDVIVFIVCPILLVGFYFYFRRKQRLKRKEEDDKKS